MLWVNPLNLLLNICNLASGELLNYAFLLIQFQETNKFLNGKFSWYGLEVLVYLGKDRLERKIGT